MGRHINEIRKRNPGFKDLVKRARQLLRSWQKLLQPAGQPVNGETPQHRAVRAVAGSEGASPASRPCTPGLHRTPVYSPVPGHRPITPGTANTLSKSRLSPKSSLRPASSVSSPALSLASSGGGSPGLPSLPRPNAGSCSGSRPNTPTTETVSKKNVANKRKRRLDSPSEPRLPHAHTYPKNLAASCDTDLVNHCEGSQTPGCSSSGGIKLTIKHDRTVNGLVSHTHVDDSHQNGMSEEAARPPLHRNASSSSLPLRHEEEATPAKAASLASLRTPKVKTTVQLMKELHESGVKLQSSETVTRIALNQIEKEDDADVSVVPAGAKPRPRRKPNCMFPPTPSQHTLNQTKEERIQSFLQTSIQPASDLMLSLDPPLLELEDDDTRSDHSGGRVNGLDHKRPLPPDEDHEQPDSSASLSQQNFLRDPWSMLPPVDLNAIDFDDDQYYITDEDVMERCTVTDSMLSRLRDSHWVGVNGHFDHQERWQDWRTVYSMPSYGGQLLHILPYVDIENNDFWSESNEPGPGVEGT